MMPDFSKRSEDLELMDEFDKQPEKEFRQNLRELEVLNRHLGGHKITLDGIDQAAKKEKQLSIMDVGFGGGDTLRAIARWMKRRNIKGNLYGVDYNPVMTCYAKEHSLGYDNIQYITADIFEPSVDEQKADIVTCSLFCHHFPHERLVRLIKRMNELAKKAVVINDLHRHWFAYHSIKVLTKLFSKTYIVKHDGPLSVARALTKSEWEQVLKEAGVTNYSIKWRWAFRWLIVIHK